MKQKTLVITMFLAFAVIVIVLIIGLTVSSITTSTASSDGDNKFRQVSDANTTSNGLKTLRTLDKKNSSNGSRDEEEELTDPLTENYSVSALAVGDWGRTIAKNGGSCCSRRKSFTVLDYNAMEYVAILLGQAAAAAEPRPSVVIGHGDNFYWDGLHGITDQAYRFQQTFEDKYNSPSLAGIPWINVMGNHDYGGASYVCTDGEQAIECSSTEALLAALDQKFMLQAQYVSPQNNRWIMSDHFFVYSIADPKTNVTIDIFNLDTNDAHSHGAQQICCQCYGYSGKDDDLCENVKRGDSLCAGGDTNMFDACMDKLQAWGDDSRLRLAEAAKASNATWKIVNTHYSPYNHYAPGPAEKWREVLDGLGIQLFFYGHTHGEKHDFAAFKTHFIENGAGGGIQNESPSGIPPYAETYVENVWAAGHYPYGFFSLKVSPTWLQVSFNTFDDSWTMTKDLDATVVGGIAIKHCWYIPQHGGRGKSCKDAETQATGSN
ncbi:Purple (tartrate-resistant) acid phosphatase [Plasmopara halstedii]|uniref:Purple (Tartrate-resistant) acid phosphatase n=1 Tax=Plasmopara halstedii TaxID=4781 RepID=A0A0P1AM54_PLAHL|nr:Purple (tartrate-resistant) acid phosphatase [Plasmopara halstedii]CEG41848.1 Purple (tartrate-resistant) acid phosphatase [Plasmopara halstedii]|eukprot:XP_024578217.1 Purple (tartrate-resistant) acid phosphatase [Plasmopara halstedii]